MKRVLSVVTVLLLCACPPPAKKPADPIGTTSSVEKPCAEELHYFEAHVWQPTLSVKCIGCHNANGTATNSRMVLSPPGMEGAVEHNFDVVKAVAAIEVEGVSVLQLRPTGRHPDGHTGGAPISTGSVAYAGLEGFVARMKTAECESAGPDDVTCASPVPGSPQLRRLTHEEYNRTVRDLLGIDTQLGHDFSSDTLVNGFTNNASVLQVTPLLADQYRQAAEDLAALAVANGTQRFVPCDPSTGSACAVQFIRSFGERAFRRPLTASEAGRYQALFESAGTFRDGVEWVITAMLQSPGFLYRPELGVPNPDGNLTLTPWEIASELSYLLSGSMPDDTLLDAARSGALRTLEQIAAHAQRLIDSPSSRLVVNRFVDAWLLTNRLEATPKDAMTYPEFSDDIRASMRAELAAYVGHVVFEGDGTLTELLTAPYTFVDARLSAFYGLQGTGQVMTGSRRGILTLGPVIAVASKPNASSPVYRGKLVRERLLCQELAPPPPGVVAQPPPVDVTRSSRERYSAHSSVQPCQSCHRLMDPIGFAFDRLDGVGRLRDSENGHAIDDSGEIVGSPSTDGTFNGTSGLADVLARSRDVQDCFVTQWVRYGYGSTENDGLQCATQDLQSRFRANLDIKQLMLSLTQTPHFTQRLGTAGIALDGGVTTEMDASVDSGDAGSLTVTNTIGTDWGAGYCEDVVVHNGTASDVTWSIELAIEGTIYNAWECTRTADSGDITFSGPEGRTSLRPGGDFQFGFCANR